jgi:hypothetical protein
MNNQTLSLMAIEKLQGELTSRILNHPFLQQCRAGTIEMFRLKAFWHSRRFTAGTLPDIFVRSCPTCQPIPKYLSLQRTCLRNSASRRIPRSHTMRSTVKCSNTFKWILIARRLYQNAGSNSMHVLTLQRYKSCRRVRRTMSWRGRIGF